MTLQTSGQISLLDIQNEFGGTSADGINLTEYYRGGAYVNSSTVAGTGSKTTNVAGVTTASPSQIPAGTAGTQIQMSQFYGTIKAVIGNSGTVTPPSSNSDFIDVTLPAGVDLIRMFLVGGGGGGGGGDGAGGTIGTGGDGGAGSTLSGTINTAWAGDLNSDRILRVFVGRGGQPGRNTSGGDTNDANIVPTLGGHGFPMYPTVDGSTWWSGSMMQTYGVTWRAHYAGGYSSGTAVQDQTMQRSIWFSSSGTYTVQFACGEGHLSIYVDGVNVAGTTNSTLGVYPGLNDQGSTSSQSWLRSTSNPLTRSFTVSTPGWHYVKFAVNSSNGQSGFAARIIGPSPSTSEIWNSRWDTTHTYGYPIGGPGAPGSVWASASGKGGGGGSATAVWLIVPSNPLPIPLAVAGGGGGGGGAGASFLPNESKSANWKTQGLETFGTYMDLQSGEEGESSFWRSHTATSTQMSRDGGGGGGGGGGLTNPRIYYNSYPNSGSGGLWARGDIAGVATGGSFIDACADGGECGRSGITPYATRYADFNHCVSTSRFVLSPTAPISNWTTIVSGGAGRGGTGGPVGGGSQTITATAGGDGAAFFDWGTATSSVAANAVTYSAVRAGIIAYTMSDPGTGTIASSTPRRFTFYNSSPFVVDAFGGGGNPIISAGTTGGGGYTYTWSNVSGTCTFSGSTPRVTVTPVSPIPTGNPIVDAFDNIIGYDYVQSGVIRVTVSDGVHTVGTADLTWTIDITPYTPPG